MRCTPCLWLLHLSRARPKARGGGSGAAVRRKAELRGPAEGLTHWPREPRDRIPCAGLGTGPWLQHSLERQPCTAYRWPCTACTGRTPRAGLRGHEGREAGGGDRVLAALAPIHRGRQGAVGYRPCGGSWRTAASVVGPSLPGRWTEQPRGRLPRPPRRQVPRQSLQQHPALRTAAPSAPGGCSTPEVRRGDGPAAPVAYDGHASLGLGLGLELVVVSVALDEAEQSLQHHASSVTLEAALRTGPLARSWSAVRAFPRPPHVSVHQHRIAYTAHPVPEIRITRGGTRTGSDRRSWLHSLFPGGARGRSGPGWKSSRGGRDLVPAAGEVREDRGADVVA